MKKGLQILRNKKDFSIDLIPQKSYFSLIWLHGLGDSSQGFFDFLQMDKSPLHKGARIKLIQAPLRSVTANNGMKMNSWYDIKRFSFSSQSDQQLYSIQQIKQSQKILHSYVQSQFEHWQSIYKDQNKQEIYKRIFVGGFSQGCAMSLLYALTCENVLGGEIGYSGHVFRNFQLKNKDKLPMLMYHGTSDQVIDSEIAMKGYQMMIGEKDNFKFNLIKGLPHSVNQRQLEETTQWMLDKLKQNKIQQ